MVTPLVPDDLVCIPTSDYLGLDHGLDISATANTILPTTDTIAGINLNQDCTLIPIDGQPVWERDTIAGFHAPGEEQPTPKSFDFFFFGGKGLSLLPTPVRDLQEAVGLVGINTESGFYAGKITAVGFEAGGKENYVAGLLGSETTTDSSAPRPIFLIEGSAGAEVPLVAGEGVGGGRYSTAEESGLYFFIETSFLGTSWSFGFGFSTSMAPSSVP
jgi:hypothetical protein